MANNVGDDIGIADDSEIETPPAVDPRPATCHRPRCRRVSSSRFRFSPSPPAAPDIGLDRSGHLFRSIDRAQDAAVPDVFVGLCQPGINNAALCRGVFIIGVGEFGAINDQFRREHDPASGLVSGRLRLALKGGGDVQGGLCFQSLNNELADAGFIRDHF